MFELPQVISKEFILSRVSQENIMEHYLGVSVDSKSFCNPLRKDNYPSCTYYKSPSGTLYMIDFTGFFKGDCFNVVMFKFSCNFARALEIIANDFNLISNAKPQNAPGVEYSNKTLSNVTKETVLQATLKEFSEEELAWWARFGISASTLDKFFVYSVQYIFINGKLSIESKPTSPIYGYYYGKNSKDVELWKFYMPKKKRFRFLMNTQKMQGTHMLPKTGDILVVTKSMKDVMVFYEMGIPAVAPQSESVILSQKDYDTYSKRFKHIVVVYDGDRAGIKGMVKCRRKFPVICLLCSDKPLKDAKDISDCVSKYGYLKTQLKVDEIKNKILTNKITPRWVRIETKMQETHGS